MSQRERACQIFRTKVGDHEDLDGMRVCTHWQDFYDKVWREEANKRFLPDDGIWKEFQHYDNLGLEVRALYWMVKDWVYARQPNAMFHKSVKFAEQYVSIHSNMGAVEKVWKNFIEDENKPKQASPSEPVGVDYFDLQITES